MNANSFNDYNNLGLNQITLLNNKKKKKNTNGNNNNSNNNKCSRRKRYNIKKDINKKNIFNDNNYSPSNSLLKTKMKKKIYNKKYTQLKSHSPLFGTKNYINITNSLRPSCCNDKNQFHILRRMPISKSGDDVNLINNEKRNKKMKTKNLHVYIYFFKKWTYILNKKKSNDKR
ncbi:hypothetical protein PFMALIP_03836 [Plasmodium falciparum MaliPS096_E11]|uniref:Uncharacterized protein n=1 Tax=Plasmodium falciparum MaliPS096_E11 TaxID=1036727 RepID=A0A024WLJ9_PLAFA|nr:hypothetical protein PFMALIP_03836 [Plasmodium falciparum MaliPS096_E11]